MATGLSRVSLTRRAAWRFRRPIISSGIAVSFSGKHIVTPRDCATSQPSSDPPPPHQFRERERRRVLTPSPPHMQVAVHVPEQTYPPTHYGFFSTLAGNLNFRHVRLEQRLPPLSVSHPYPRARGYNIVHFGSCENCRTCAFAPPLLASLLIGG